MAQDKSGKKSPNILYLFTDDQSHRTVGCYPEAFSWVKTPNIDRLAAEGVRFESAYMGGYCVPSRATQLTGLLPHAIQTRFFGEELKGEALEKEIREFPFLPQSIRRTGYHTALIGKWHLYGRPPAMGVDWDHAIYWNKKIDVDYYYNQKVSYGGKPPVDLEGYSVDRYTDFAMDYIRERAAVEEKQPWYLWVCYASPHSPQIPAHKYEGTLKEEVADLKAPADAVSPRLGKPFFVRDAPDVSLRTIRSLSQRYHECILSIDESVGRLVECLREEGELENTVIIFASDQGLGVGHHGFIKKKNAPYDATIRSPLIFRYPAGFAKGLVRREPVGGPDLAQTLLDLTGAKSAKITHGESLVPLLRNAETKPKRKTLLVTNTRTFFGDAIPRGVEVLARKEKRGDFGNDGMPMWAMIRSGRYKYMTYTGLEGFEEVYDLAADPAELINLAGEPEHAGLLKRLRRETIWELRRGGSAWDGGRFEDFFPHLKNEVQASKPTRN